MIHSANNLFIANRCLEKVLKRGSSSPKWLCKNEGFFQYRNITNVVLCLVGENCF
jgi:hypothetical protein